nr:hypothetical protein [uncultured Phocaeicola sp.]
MGKEFSSIIELMAIREQKSRLSERESELSSPILSDTSMISEVYSMFCKVLSERDCPPRTDNVYQRKKFLFIALFLFAPSVLAGGRLPNGIRAELARIFPDVSPCVISNNITDVLFIYQNYKDFRQDIEYLYNKILERLKAKGLIK